MSSYYQHQQQPPPQQQNPTSPHPPQQPTNGSLSNSNSSAVKKRGRPRKYNTPEQAAAARRAQLALPKKPKTPFRRRRRNIVLSSAVVSATAKGPHLLSACGECWSPHVVLSAVEEGKQYPVPCRRLSSLNEEFISHKSPSVGFDFTSGKRIEQKILDLNKEAERFGGTVDRPPNLSASLLVTVVKLLQVSK